MTAPAQTGLTLDQFEQEVRSDINAFFAYWRRMNQKHPDAFPLSLPEDNAGDWHEQLIFFLSDPQSTLDRESEFPKPNAGRPSS